MTFRNLSVLILVLAAFAIASAQEQPEGPPRQKRTPTYTEGGSEDCLRCHSGERMRTVLASPHGNDQNPASPASANGCESCHGPGSIHISRAHGGRGFPPLISFGRGSGASDREVQIEVCLGCHAEAGVGKGLITFRGSPHDRRTINCSTCHSIHEETDPMRVKDQQRSTCNRCHRRHIDEHRRFEDKGIDFDALSCWTCHDVHATVSLENGPMGG